MSIELYLHPLSSYCHKVLIGLYDCSVAFEKVIVDDLTNAETRTAYEKISPLGKIPALVDGDHVVTESSIILEYACPSLIPPERDAQRAARYWDRFFDLYIHTPVQNLVGDRLRPEAKKDPYGVEQNKAALERAYVIVDKQLRDRKWAIGDAFTIADCSAAPPLFYASKLVPFTKYDNVAAYFDRLKARPSFARALEEAEPYFNMFPS